METFININQFFNLNRECPEDYYKHTIKLCLHKFSTTTSSSIMEALRGAIDDKIDDTRFDWVLLRFNNIYSSYNYYNLNMNIEVVIGLKEKESFKQLQKDFNIVEERLEIGL